MKKALITGISGQDGSYLAEFLLKKGYEVYGVERRCSTKNRINTDHIQDKIHWLNADLSDQNSLLRAIRIADPDEVYNLAAQSFVGESWNTPEQTSDINALGALRMLEAIREFNPNIRFYQASTSEMFGKVKETPQKETTPFHPRSPYGVAKLYGHWITTNYRESYDMFACSGILFNHESERRGVEFVTRKITNGIAKIKLGIEDYITLGNLDAKRDWGHAEEYVEAMWLMLQQDKPEDYVISTGKSHSIKDFLDIAFKYVGIDDWSGYVKKDPALMRPAEVDLLIGDSSKAEKNLGWKTKMELKDLVHRMLDNDLKQLGENKDG
jgi:GDPmannose 4,6-dehydratase